jgi:hypothetical protein
LLKGHESVTEPTEHTLDGVPSALHDHIPIRAGQASEVLEYAGIEIDPTGGVVENDGLFGVIGTVTTLDIDPLDTVYSAISETRVGDEKTTAVIAALYLGEEPAHVSEAAEQFHAELDNEQVWGGNVVKDLHGGRH